LPVPQTGVINRYTMVTMSKLSKELRTREYQKIA